MVSAIPAQATFVRNLPLPFRDPRKIREVLKFEIEPHIPYPVEDVIVDFAKIHNLETGGCEVLAAAVSKKVMADHLHVLDLAGLTPEVVDWEIFGELNSYLAWRPLAESGPVALINLGATKTTVKIIQDGSIRFARSIIRGGNALTESIRQRLTLTSAQAEAMKLSDRDRDRASIADTIETFLGMLAKEIDHTLLAYNTRAGEEPVQEIVLLGGGAGLPEAVPFFEAHYGLPTTLFDMDRRLFPPSPTSLQPQAGLVMPVAFGLASRQLNRRALGLDFRQEEFALRKSYDEDPRSTPVARRHGGLARGAITVRSVLPSAHQGSSVCCAPTSGGCHFLRDVSRSATSQQCAWPRAGKASRDRGQPEGRWYPQWAAGLGIGDAA